MRKVQVVPAIQTADKVPELVAFPIPEFQKIWIMIQTELGRAVNAEIVHPDFAEYIVKEVANLIETIDEYVKEQSGGALALPHPDRPKVLEYQNLVFAWQKRLENGG